MTDTEILDWLAERCWYPDDHPLNEIGIFIPEEFAPAGSFTLSPDNDRKVLRDAVNKAMNQ